MSDVTDSRRDHCARLAGHTGAVTCLALAHSSCWLVTGSEDATLRIWNMASALPQCRRAEHQRGGGPSKEAGRSGGGGAVGGPVLLCESLCVSELTGHSLQVTGVSITPSDR